MGRRFDWIALGLVGGAGEEPSLLPSLLRFLATDPLLVYRVLIASLSWAQGADAEVCSLVLETPEVVPSPFLGAVYPTAVSFSTTGRGLTPEAQRAEGLG